MKHPAKLHTSLLTAIVTSLIVGCSGTYAGSNVRQGSENQDVTLNDSAGMAYYTFDKDTKNAGTSACYQGCAVQWPPVPAGSSTGQSFGKIERTDGSQQLTFNGQPLYYFIGDVNPGDQNGDGMGGSWHLAKSSKAEESNDTGSYIRSGGGYRY